MNSQEEVKQVSFGVMIRLKRYNRDFKQIATAGAETAAGSKFRPKWDTAHVRQLHPAVAWNLTTSVGMFCRGSYYVGFISLLWPFSTDISVF